MEESCNMGNIFCSIILRMDNFEMKLSDDELVHIASFLQDEDFRSFRNCNSRMRTLEYYPIRYLVLGVTNLSTLVCTINKCIFISITTIITYLILITLVIGIAILTTNTQNKSIQNIVGYICVISSGALIMSLILFLFKSLKIKRDRLPIIRSTSHEYKY